jgi:hypothetical protein
MSVRRSPDRSSRRRTATRALWAATALTASFVLTQACSVLLPWDGYTGTGANEGTDATSSTDAEAGPLTDAATDVQTTDAALEGGDGGVEGGLAPFEVPCGAALACINSKACCAYGDGRPWACGTTCASIDGAGAILRCDSPTDCVPGARCCSELSDAGSLVQTFCSATCPGALLRTCDPAYGTRDCALGSSCTRVIDSGYPLAYCEAIRDQ